MHNSSKKKHNVKDPLQIALFGTFDVDNYGDCLFPLITEYQLLKRLKNCKISLFSPTNRLPRIANYSKVHAFDDLPKVFPETLSAVVIGGGALITTEHALSVYPQLKNQLYPYALKCWLLPIMFALSRGCSSFVNAVGIGPFDEDFLCFASKYLQKVDLCAVRDPFSAEFMKQIGVNAETVADSGFLIKEIIDEAELKNYYSSLCTEYSLPPKFIVVQASLSLGKLHKDFAIAIAEVARKTNLPLVLLPICHHHSDNVSLSNIQKILKQYKIMSFRIDKILSTFHTTSILAMSEMYLGTSLHGAIVSIAFGKPVLSFSTMKRTKRLGVLSLVGLEDCNVWQVDQITPRTIEILKSPRARYEKAASIGAQQSQSYFDRVCELIATQQKASTRQIYYDYLLKQDIESDYHKIRKLCLKKRREINQWKNLISYIFRTDPSRSELYDRLIFWLKNNNIILRHKEHKPQI